MEKSSFLAGCDLCDHCMTMFLFLAHAFHRLCTKRSYRHGTKRHQETHGNASKCVAGRNDPQPQFNSDQVHHGRCSDVCFIWSDCDQLESSPLIPILILVVFVIFPFLYFAPLHFSLSQCIIWVSAFFIVFRFLPKWQACKIHHLQVLRASRAVPCSVWQHHFVHRTSLSLQPRNSSRGRVGHDGTMGQDTGHHRHHKLHPGLQTFEGW